MIAARASAFFDYLSEREEVRLRKEAGFPFPWTEDKILRTYKFTNVQRYNDRTSRELRTLFYNDHFFDDKPSILMNCALFRYFGTSEFAEAVGWQSYDTFDFERIKDVARERMVNRERVFTGAYVITNQGISAPKEDVVVDYFLRGLHAKAKDLCATAALTESWKEVAGEMRSISGFGGTGFMAKEVLLDTTYTSFWSNVQGVGSGNVLDRFSFPEDWWRWTPVGPGALRGAGRVYYGENFSLSMKIKEDFAFNVIMHLYENQELYWNYLPKLSPTDIQFGLCEFDKYERVRLGQGKPRSTYKP